MHQNTPQNTVGGLGNIDLSSIAMRLVENTRLFNVSPHWVIPNHLRWLPMATEDLHNGVFYVAQGISNGRRTLWYFRECDVCGGLYLAHRIDSSMCSSHCRNRKSRMMSNLKRSGKNVLR